MLSKYLITKVEVHLSVMKITQIVCKHEIVAMCAKWRCGENLQTNKNKTSCFPEVIVATFNFSEFTNIQNDLQYYINQVICKLIRK